MEVEDFVGGKVIRSHILLIHLTKDNYTAAIASSGTFLENTGYAILFLTDQFDQEVISRARSVTHSGFLIFPLHSQQLQASLETIINANPKFTQKTKPLNTAPPVHDIYEKSIAGNSSFRALKHKTILLVEDDENNAFTLKVILESHGMTVHTRSNGKEAVQFLMEHGIVDLVLMDIMMPVMDGYEAMREIRKQTLFQTMPIIALTAKIMKSEVSRCIESGASDYFPKPIDVDRLLSRLKIWLY
ncbi:MAG: response regulator [SAR324 cluster bacterium]|nr:response regulator [SAR324 cluster bacterium]